MIKYSLTFVLTAACSVGGSFGYQPGQARAEQLVWREIYSMKEPCPPVEWFDMDTIEIAGQQEDGFTWAGWKIQIATKKSCKCGLWVTAFAHELMHYRTWIKTGDVDPFHFRGNWSLEKDADFAMQMEDL